MPSDPLRYFRLEARELLDQSSEALLELDKNERASAPVQRLLRLAHTLKGAARVVKQPQIAERAHAIEDELSSLRDSEAKAPRALIDAIGGHLHEIAIHVQALGTGAAASPETPVQDQTRPAAEEALQTVRTDVADVDALLEGVSEAHVLLNGLRPAAQSIEQGRHMVGLLLEQLGARSGVDPANALASAYSTAEQLQRRLTRLERSLETAIAQIDVELRQLRVTAEQFRLAPAGALFTVLERTARDSAQALGKRVAFEGVGETTRLDAHVMTAVQSALIQLVRNAVAHGIEAEADRLAAGKPAQGRVVVKIARRGRRIVFECQDDGRGLDLGAVRAAAVRQGLDGAEVERMSADELTRLLLKGGISTAATVTETSGRGVGLDVVRDVVERLRGEIVVRSEPGRGTTIELIAPLSLAAVDALVTQVGESAVAIPFDAVRQAKLVAVEDISPTASGASVIEGEAAIPFVALSRLLDEAEAPARQSWPVLVVQGAGGLAAVGVDGLLGSARVVVRPLPELAPASSILAGVTLDAEGHPQLMLDPDGIVAAAARGEASGLDQSPSRLPVLVVDDSLTTRMLEQSILEAAGYQVEVASSAEEALERIKTTRYGVWLVDVEMPGMDGFTFVERTRLDPTLREAPAIMVTSLDSADHRQRGRDVGAKGYVVKSQFDQAELLTMIRNLMEEA